MEKSTSWERNSNDLFISKRAFRGNPQATKNVIKTIGEDGVSEIDYFFKKRFGAKKLNPKGAIYQPAISEILTNDEGVKVYCFDGIILPFENYNSPQSLNRRDYTIMLLAEIISCEIQDVLISNDMNEILRKRKMKNECSIQMYKQSLNKDSKKQDPTT